MASTLYLPNDSFQVSSDSKLILEEMKQLKYFVELCSHPEFKAWSWCLILVECMQILILFPAQMIYLSRMKSSIDKTEIFFDNQK